MRLPRVLTPADLPAPELQAARLDGQLYAVGAGFSPVDEVEQPRHRAAALRGGERLIAEQLSAAWVWGALDVPPARHQFCVAIGARVNRDPGRGTGLREVVISEAEVAWLDGTLVTTPTRTIVDLARFSSAFDAGVVRRLIGVGASLPDALASLDDRRNLPGKKRAFARLSRC